MKTELHHDKDTDVAYVDVCATPESRVRIDVVDVTEQLEFKTQVLARVDENGQLLGLIIQDYSIFKRELRRKYLTLAVEKILDLIISKVRDLTSRTANCSELHQLAAHV
jgi:uncharacterized protein YuzE